uniref:Lipase_3 domain-containing protein n=1 Tax=Rhabditophanes sp. KR3021 TaxID=114890 RepID=A0AC35U970_9BILA
MILPFYFLLLVSLAFGGKQNNFTGKYSASEGEVCAHLCAHIYGNQLAECLEIDIKVKYAVNLLKESKYFDVTSGGTVKYAIYEYLDQNGTLIIVEKGSSSLVQLASQAVTSILFPLIDYFGKGRVWNYQIDAFHSHSLTLIQELASLYRTRRYKNVIFTGHSLAGSISKVNAYFCVAHGTCRSDNTKVISFGAPKSGDKVFADHYNSIVPLTYRVVNQNDLITEYPLNEKFVHVGTKIWYSHGTNYGYKQCAKHNPDPCCSIDPSLSIFEKITITVRIITEHSNYFTENLSNSCKASILTFTTADKICKQYPWKFILIQCYFI